MANKRLGTTAAELRLPVKKVKGEKKPRWQAKIGGRKGKPELVVESPEVVVDTTPDQDEPTLPPEPTETSVLATIP